jgi:hypothetical protein
MARFQALTNRVLDADLERLRSRLQLRPNQKSELLREVTALAAWVVRQAELGRVVRGQGANGTEELAHPVVERLRKQSRRSQTDRIALNRSETRRLAVVLDRGFDPPPALRKALASLANPRRRSPKLRWKKSAA